MRTLTVRYQGAAGGVLGYPVHVGAGALDRLIEDLRDERPGGGVAVVSDDRVAPLHAEPLAARVRALGLRTEVVRFPHGEGHKTRETKAAVEDRLAAFGLGRDGTVLAVGGGVVGDLAGFVAATWQRGVRLRQVPTTVLAMLDAAIGGKTGVDLPSAKNAVGAFHVPAAVYADTATLATLPDDEVRHGLAEAVKAAVVGDAALFDRIEAGAARLAARDPSALEAVIAAAAAVKVAVVSDDPLERGRRVMLNFGHTVGHAIESASAYRVAHGAAVAAGMTVEARLARDACGFPGSDVARLEGVLARLGLPLEPPAAIDPGRLLEAARSDKKNRDGRIRFALPARIGAMPDGADPTVAIDPEDILAALSPRGR